MDIFLFAVASFLFGFTTDFADLLDEHGLKWFKFSDILFGILWGLFGAYIILTNAPAGLFVMALVLYWLSRGKLDYPNHILAGIIIFISALWFFSQTDLSPIYMLIPFFICFLVGHVGTYIKNHYKLSKAMERIILIRHFIAPIVLSFMLSSFYPLALSVLFFAGSNVSNTWFKNFTKTGSSRLAKTLSISL